MEMKPRLHLLLTLILAVSCRLAEAQLPSTVLVVGNANNANSVILVNTYAQARAVPASNKLLLNLPSAFTPDNCATISMANYQSLLLAPILARIKTLHHIDYIVLCRNLPIMITDTSGSVDSALAGQSISQIPNHYCGYTTAFNSTTYGMYLVTRLDGWSWADATALVTHSIAAKKGAPVFLDECAYYNQFNNYVWFNQSMSQAAIDTQANGVPVILSTISNFYAPSVALGGYYSWGSNDNTFSAAAFAALQFSPGAIAETLVSTSASNLRTPGGAQSQIAQLVHQGVTGIKGYVSEPNIDACAIPDILFPYYTSGSNLAEAFYAASIYVGWRDVVVGDPLCCPY